MAHYPEILDDLHLRPNDEPLPNSLEREATLRSPVTRLPPEILAYIFELCQVGEDMCTPVFVPAQGLFCFAQICRVWRAVAESNPRLWTSIHFYFSDALQNRKEDVSRVKPVFDLHLKRSGALPISLTFTDHRLYDAATEDLIALMVDRLRAHSRRWVHVSLHLSCGYFPLLFTFMPCDLSSLEQLHISGDMLGQRIVTTLHLNLESAKNLKSFSYSGPGHSLDDKIDLPWEQLEDVAFEFSPHNGMSSTLSRQFGRLAQCQNITTCSLGIDRPFWLDLHGDQTITLPCLRTLRARRLSLQSHARTVIDTLILPQLQMLEIDAAIIVGWDGWNLPWHHRNFSNLLARSGCTLRRLSIQDVYFPNDELVRCLALSPTLTSLRFIPCPRSQDMVDVIRRLDVSHAAVGHERKHVWGGPLVPGLREITLASSVETCLDCMLAMCRSRVGARALAAKVATLRHVEAVFFDVLHGTDVARVGVSGGRLGKVAGLRKELARWVSENENERKNGCVSGEEEERLEASVVIESPYGVDYIDLV